MQNPLPMRVVDGTGNLIVGYNQLITDDVYTCSDGQYTDETTCTAAGGIWSNQHLTGSHNIVAGEANNYSQYGGLIVGRYSTINRRYASVSGGWGNRASGVASSISGGQGSRASGDYSSISGGWLNRVYGDRSSVSGGRLNRAYGDWSSILGGNENTANGSYSSVAGGDGNTSGGDYSSVSGGHERSASGIHDWAAGSLFEDY